MLAKDIKDKELRHVIQSGFAGKKGQHGDHSIQLLGHVDSIHVVVT